MQLQVPLDTLDVGMFDAIFRALDASSERLIGSARSRLMVIPIRDDAGVVTGGLWGHTLFQWLVIEMLVIPEALRNQGIGSALVAQAETEARTRGCIGAYVDTFSFQAAPFYRKLGFTMFGMLENFPPGYNRLYFSKRFASPPPEKAGAPQ